MAKRVTPAGGAAASRLPNSGQDCSLEDKDNNNDENSFSVNYFRFIRQQQFNLYPLSSPLPHPGVNGGHNHSTWDDHDASQQNVSPILFPNPVEESMEGHIKTITSLLITKDNEFLWTASEDCTIKKWIIKKRTCILTLIGHNDWVNSIAISDDNSRVVSGSADKTIKIWDSEDGRCLDTLEGHKKSVTSILMNDEYIMSGSYDLTIKLWNIDSKECCSTLDGHEGLIFALALHAKLNYIISGSKDNTIKIWNIATRECIHTLEGHAAPVRCVTVSHDGQYVISGGLDNTIKVWSISTHECMATLEGHNYGVFSVSMSPDDRHIISGSEDGALKIWNMSTKEHICSLRGHKSLVTSAQVTSDGNYIVSGSADKLAKVWNITSQSVFSEYEGHVRSVTSVTITPNCKYILSGSYDSTIRLWSLSNTKCEHIFTGHKDRVSCVCSASDSLYFVSGSYDTTIKVWDLETKECLTTLRGHTDRIASVTLTSDGRRIISGSKDCTIRVWDRSTSLCLATLKGHEQHITCVRSTYDCQYLLSGSKDSTVKLWSLTSFDCLLTYQGHHDRVYSVAISKAGNFFVSCSSDLTIKVWKMLSASCLFTLRGHEDAIFSVDVTDDGQYIVSGGKDNRLKIWSTLTRECLSSIECHQSWIYSTKVLRNLVITGSGDKTIKVHPLQQTTYATIPINIIHDLVKLFKAHKGSVCNFEDLVDICPSFLSDVFLSNDGTRSTTFLAHLIELDASDRMLKELFKLRKPEFIWNNLMHRSNYTGDPQKYQNVLEMLMSTKRERGLETLLNQIIFGLDQYNQIRIGNLSRSQASWLLTPDIILKATTFSLFICELIRRYPSMAEMFLAKVGALKCFPQVDATTLAEFHDVKLDTVLPLKSTLPEDPGFLVKSSEELVKHSEIGFWDDFLQDSVGAKVVESRLLPFSYAGGNSSLPNSILKAVVNSNRASLCDNATVRVLVEYKWQTFGRMLFLKEMSYYLLSLFLLMLLLLIRTDPHDHLTVGEMARGSTREKSVLVITLFVLFESVITLCHECYQVMVMGVGEYLQIDWKNYVDLIVVLLTWITCIGILLGWRHHVVSLALALLLKWLGFLYFLQAFSSTGALVRMVLQIVVDMRHFMVILLVALLAAASAFYALLHQPTINPSGNPFYSVGSTLFYMFNMLLLGDFQTDLFIFGEYKELIQVIFVLVMILTLIILLNLLIALMSDSYERIQDQSEIEFLMLRARMIVAMESLFSEKDRQNLKYFPRYYFVLAPLGDGKMNHLSSGDQWNGVLNALKSELRVVRDRQERMGGALKQIDEKISKVEMRIDLHLQRMEEKFGRNDDKLRGPLASTMNEMEKRLQGLEVKVGNLDQKFDQLFHYLKDIKG